MDYDMMRLFRSEASCELLYSLLEVDADMRPSAKRELARLCMDEWHGACFLVNELLSVS